MASVNKVILIGNLGKDPEVKYFPSGGALCNVTIATSESWKDKTTGEQKERTEWHNVVFNNKLAEIAGQYLKKGSQIYVEGSIRTKKYTDKDGVEKFSTEIRGERMQMLGGRQGMGGDGGGGGYSWQAAALFAVGADYGLAGGELLDGSVGFGGEESAGASFLRHDGSVWTTDKDGIIEAN